MLKILASLADNAFWIICGVYSVYLSIEKKDTLKNIAIFMRVCGIILIIGGVVDLVMTIFRN